MDAAVAERVGRLLRQPLEWAKLLSLARQHGTLPLLYRHLHRLHGTTVPPEWMARLRDEYSAQSLRNLRATKELFALLRQFADHEIPVIPFKGPVLALSVYGSLSLRKVGDLDILIDPRDISRAREVMESQGYRIVTPLGENGLPSREGKHEYRFTCDEGRVSVELRWRLASQPLQARLPFEHLWERSKVLPLHDTKVMQLPPEELLLILCWHGCQHAWERLMWLSDLPEVLRAYPELDWNRALSQAGRIGCSRMLALSLLLAHDLLELPLPDEVLRRIRSDPEARALAAEVGGYLRSGRANPIRAPLNGGPATRESLKLHRRYYQRVMEHQTDRLHYSVRHLHRRLAPTSKDRAVVSLPQRLQFLYYVIRPLRLSAEYGWLRFQGHRRKGEGHAVRLPD